uniref:Uncharacterized protein n=1 Tax=Anguilla anguilla TaxID=7936 RepID=A0A0E9U915_ANGAN
MFAGGCTTIHVLECFCLGRIYDF